jgi:thiosulfate dehydrogenase [quinone] large subunit
MLFAIAVALILAWKVAGWYGLDRYLLPRIGVPWTWRNEQAATKPPSTPQPTPTA